MPGSSSRRSRVIMSTVKCLSPVLTDWADAGFRAEPVVPVQLVFDIVKLVSGQRFGQSRCRVRIDGRARSRILPGLPRDLRQKRALSAPAGKLGSCLHDHAAHHPRTGGENSPKHVEEI
jgi:hypothetical protein